MAVFAWEMRSSVFAILRKKKKKKKSKKKKGFFFYETIWRIEKDKKIEKGSF